MKLFAPLLLIGLGIATFGSAPIQARDSADTTFDIDISLRATPQGPARKPYEDAIEEFGYAVCEQTNGSHTIGDVRVYPGLGLGDKADVIWETTCVNTPSYAYVKVADKKIRMCEQWNGISFIANAKASGYTLAHEWGHAKYRLYDEYRKAAPPGVTHPAVPRSTDTESSPSVMNNQLCAVSSSFSNNARWKCRPSTFTNPEVKFLEFSTDQIAPFSPPLPGQPKGTNAQLRMYGQSGWDTLIADPKQDPKSNLLGPRTRYTSLTRAGVVPPVNADYTKNDGSACRTSQTSPNITWIEGIALDILLDRSGSWVVVGSPTPRAARFG